jgi:predicted ester cyclase
MTIAEPMLEVPASGPGPVQQRNLQTLEAFYDAFNAHDVGRLVTAFANEHKDDDLRLDHAAARSLYRDIGTRFPDVRMDVKELVAVDDHVIARCVCSGTHLGVGRHAWHDGAMMVGVPPTGARFAVQHMHWWTLKDGQIVRRRAREDDVAMLMQLGLLPRNERVAQPAGLEEPTIPHAHYVGGPERRRNAEVVLRNMEAIANNDVEASLACTSPDAINHGRAAGREGMALVFADLVRTYTNVDPDDDGVRDLVAIDDCVITWSDMMKRHTGKSQLPIDGALLMGREPTGREYRMRHIHWWRLRDGLIFDHRACRDDVAMGIELGVLQPPADPRSGKEGAGA